MLQANQVRDGAHIVSVRSQVRYLVVGHPDPQGSVHLHPDSALGGVPITKAISDLVGTVLWQPADDTEDPWGPGRPP